MKTKGRSKKSRRADEVEQAFKEAEATADRAAAQETQSQMLLALFEIFFRVLKQCTQSGIQAQGPGEPFTLLGQDQVPARHAVRRARSALLAIKLSHCWVRIRSQLGMQSQGPGQRCWPLNFHIVGSGSGLS